MPVWWSGWYATLLVAEHTGGVAVRWLAADRFRGWHPFGVTLVPVVAVRWALSVLARSYDFILVNPASTAGRGRAVREAYRTLHRQRHSVGILPEAGNAPGHSGELIRAVPGSGPAVAWLSRGVVPVVPMGLWEDEQGRVVARVGVPYTLEQPPANLGSGEQLALTERVMRSVAELLPEGLRGAYAERPVGAERRSALLGAPAAGPTEPLLADTLPAVLGAAAARYGDAIAVQAVAYTGQLEAITYRELERCALAIRASQLHEVRRGDFVVLGGRNSTAWIAALFAIVMAGGVAVPLDHEASEAFIGAVVAQLRPRVLVGDRAFLVRCPPGPPRCVLEETPREPPADATPPVALVPEEPALLLFTAGTTGDPKGVLLTHDNVCSNVRGVVDAAGLGPGDVVFLVLPLFHSFPLTVGCVSAIAAGVRIELEHRLLRIAPRVRAARPTVILGVPALYETLLRQIERRALGAGRRGRLARAVVSLNHASIRLTGVNLARVLLRPVQRAFGGRLRYAVSGGAALPVEVAHTAAIYGIPLVQGYGLSEASPVVTVPRFRARRFWWTRYYWDRAGSVGTPLRNVRVRLDPIAGGEPGEGELVVEGSNVMHGYLADERATAHALRGGALHTGDLARIDRDGWVWITGRAKLAVSTPEGKLVHLEAIERALNALPEIEQARVQVEERPWRLVAVVFPAAGADPDGTASGAEIEQRVRAAVAAIAHAQRPHERVDEVWVTDQPFPTTRLGKIRRGGRPVEISFDPLRWRERLAESTAARS